MNIHQQGPGTNTLQQSRWKSGGIPLAVLFVLAAAIIIVIPYFYVYVRPWKEVVLQVKERTYTLGDLLRAHRIMLSNPASASLDETMRLLTYLQDCTLIEEEAEKRGIRANPWEIDEELRKNLPSPTPNPADQKRAYRELLKGLGIGDEDLREWMMCRVLRRKLKGQMSQSIPSLAEQIHLFAILAPNSREAQSLRGRILAGEDFQRVARRESRHWSSRAKGGDWGWIPRGVYEIHAVKQVRIRGVLIKTLEEAHHVRERILDGLPFGEAARRYSIHLGSRDAGGMLGWVAEETNPQPVSNAEIFQLPVGLISEPLPCPEGYWIAQVLERSPGGSLVDDIAFSLEVGKVSPPILTRDGSYLLLVSERSPQRPISRMHREVLKEKRLKRWLSRLAEQGSSQGWIHWHMDSKKYSWLLEQLRY